MTEILCACLGLVYIGLCFAPSLWRESKLTNTHRMTIGEQRPSNRAMHE